MTEPMPRAGGRALVRWVAAAKFLHFTVFLCHRPKGWTLQTLWPRLKEWN